MSYFVTSKKIGIGLDSITSKNSTHTLDSSLFCMLYYK